MPAKFNPEKFHAVRKAKNITQEKLAEQAGTSGRYIRELESGRKHNPSASLLCQMSVALDVQMEDFMEIT